MKRLGEMLFYTCAVMMTVFSLQASAAEANMSGRDFNHLTTGFPLIGGHAATPCETCHLGGVFKGTPKTCDGCHALGKRIVATPKSTSHIVTDAPCETCHFNTSTFLGAKFNHGTAMAGQCVSCHNGRLSMARPPSHSSGNKATNSCDQCHRTYAWLPASWNHSGATPGQCATQCHNGTGAPGQPSGHSTATLYNKIPKSNYFPACDTCHSFTGWSPAPFKHLVAGLCSDCHDYNGKPTPHIAVAPGATCDNCHRSRTSWLPASMHTGNEAGICRSCHNNTANQDSKHTTTTIATLSCDVCHTQTTWTGAHTYTRVKSYCGVCHYTDSKAIKKHGTISVGSKYYNCGDCHRSTSKWD